MDKPGFILPPPWLSPAPAADESDPDDEVATDSTTMRASFPAFRPIQAEPRRPRRWLLTFEDGQAVDVAGAVVLGRSPAPVPGHPDARLVSVQDPARSVSKTHAVVFIADHGLSVTDLDSTNGVSATVPDGAWTDLEPGATQNLLPGSVLMLGQFTVQVALK
ncbi:FHA domain-containing protein [Cryobacterium sp. TmT2-59]|uniref:FHA domain-containing protein n=1 Tax=Cryobacterium sp. TmT2-59 TaxID=1259264 RepID=UPI00106A06AE|nr:FHA domain-containing protein [Cryobacterium sp. TmT2-59]TFC87792.1 FHA domain-containing protein [Cryobacterium sp. TmT2-59]